MFKQLQSNSQHYSFEASQLAPGDAFQGLEKEEVKLSLPLREKWTQFFVVILEEVLFHMYESVHVCRIMHGMDAYYYCTRWSPKVYRDIY